jgi:hypothetical protein
MLSLLCHVSVPYTKVFPHSYKIILLLIIIITLSCDRVVYRRIRSLTHLIILRYIYNMRARACKAHTDRLLISYITYQTSRCKESCFSVSLAIEPVSNEKIAATVNWTILYHDLQTLFTVMISIVFGSLIIHEFDNRY